MFYLAFQNLKSRPVRSLLAIIGVTVAIFAMVGLFSVSAGLDKMVSSTLNRVPGFVAMQRGAPIPLFSTLPASWMKEIDEIPGVRVVSPECWARVNVINGKIIVSPPRLLCGTDIKRRNLLKTSVYRKDVFAGNFLTEDDIGTNNCVVSKQIAEEFKRDVGGILNVNGHDMKIVGIYQTGSLLLDVAIITDIDVFRRMTRFDEESVSSFYIEQDGTVDDDTLAKAIREKFADRNIDEADFMSSVNRIVYESAGNPLQIAGRTLSSAFGLDEFSSPPSTVPPDNKTSQTETEADPSRPDDNSEEDVLENGPMEVRLAVQWASRFESLSKDLDIFLTLMTCIGVVIAVVCVVNTMLMSVSERVVEFGILRANGWSRRDIGLLIACESGVLGIVGGIAGSAFGWIGVQVVNALFPTRLELYAGPALLSFGIIFSAVLGIIGGLYPAIWAMRQSPLEAIRRG